MIAGRFETSENLPDEPATAYRIVGEVTDDGSFVYIWRYVSCNCWNVELLSFRQAHELCGLLVRTLETISEEEQG